MSKRRILATIGLVILAVLVAALLLVHTPPARRFVLEKAEGALAGRGIDFHAQSLDYNLLELAVTLNDVTVSAAQPAGMPAFARIGRFHINLGWADLIHGVIHVQDGAIENLQIHYVVTAGGKSNLPVPPKSSSSQPTQIPNFRIDHFLISNASLHVEDHAQNLALSLPQWRLQVSGQPSGMEQVKLALERQGTATMRGRSLPIRKIDLDALAGTNSVNLQGLELATAQSDLKLSGTVEDFSQPKLNLALAGNLALEQLANFAGIQAPAAGDVQLTVHASGPMNSLDASFAANSAQVRYGEFRDVNLSLQGMYNRAQNRVEVSVLRVRAPLGNIDGQAAIALGGSGSSSVRAEVEHLNLQRITRAVDLGMRVASTATGSLNFTWPGMNYRQASGRALLTLKKLQPNAARNELPISGDVQAIARNGHLTLKIGNPGAPSHALKEIQSFRSKLEAALRGMIAGFRTAANAATPIASFPADTVSPLQPRLRGALRQRPASAYREADPPEPFLDVDIGNSNQRKERRVHLQRVSLVVAPGSYPAIEGARLDVSPRILLALFAFAQSQNGNPDPQSSRALELLATRLHGQISISAQGALSGTLHANITDLGEFLAELANFQGKSGTLLPVPVRGPIAVTATLDGTLKRPAAEIALSAPSVTVGDLANVSLDARAHYDASQMLIRQATLNFGNQEQLILAGSVGLGGKSPSLDLTAQIPTLSVKTVLAALQRTSIPAAGTVSFHATVHGTVARPVVQVSVNASGLQAYGENWGSLALNASLENNLLRVSQLRLNKTPNLPGQTLNAELTYNLQTQAYTLSANTSGLTIQNMQLPGGRSFQGQIGLHAQGSGSVNDPRLQANLDLSGLTFNQQNFGDVTASVNLANQTANVDLSAPQWETSLTAQAGIQSPYRGTFHLQTQSLAINGLPVKLPQALQQGGLAGTVSLDVEGQGPLAQPQQLDLTARIPQLNLTFEGQTISLPQPLVARYVNHVLQFEPSTVVAGASQIQIAGRLPLEAGAASTDLHLTGTIDLASAVQFLPAPAAPTGQGSAQSAPSQSAGETSQNSGPSSPATSSPNPSPNAGQTSQASATPASGAPPPQRLAATGQLHIDLTLGGTLKNIVPQGSFSMQNASLSGPPLPAPVQGLTLEGKLRNGMVQLQQLEAQVAGGQIRASGNMPLDLLPKSLPLAAPPANQPASFQASVTGLNVGEIGNLGDTVTGTVSLSLQAQAPRLDVDAIDAQLRIDELDLKAGTIPIGQQGQSLITLRNGQASLQHFTITGPDTELALAGTAGLAAPRNLNLQVHGHTNAALAAAFSQGLKAQGATDIQISVAGTMAQPQMQGYIAMQGGQFSLETPQVGLTGMNFRLNLSGRQIQIAQLSGTLNGGQLNGSGSFLIGSGGIQNPDVRISAKDVYMNFPEGLRSVSSFELTLKPQDKFLLLGGDVHIQEAFFRRNVNVQTQLASYLTASPGVTLTGQRSAFLDRIRFNINVDTRSPIAIDNNLARAGIDTALRLVNSYYDPSLVGRVTFQEAGELYLSGHTFYIDRGDITFLNERRIEPDLDILTHTQADGYTINMLVQGRSGNIQTTLTSDPTLPEPDIVSVLVFGQPLSQVRGAAATIAQQQAFSLIAGTLGGTLSQQLQSATGLSQVSIEPSLIANEATPTARLTVGQQLAKGLRLVYSVNLSDAGDQIWLGEYKFTPRLLTRITKQTDNSYRFDLSDEMRFGNAPNPVIGNPVPNRKVKSVTFTGNTLFSDKELADKFGVHPGDKYDFFKVRKGLDKIESLYPDQQRLESTVRLNLNQQPSTVDINIAVHPGPIVLFSYEGWDVPGSVRKHIRNIWKQGVFDQQRVSDAVEALRGALIDRGYVQAKITDSIKMEGQDNKRVVFDIQAGKHFSNVKTVYQGAKAISPDTLDDVMNDSDLKGKLLTQPADVRNLLQTYYNQQGYLRAKVQDPHPQVDSRTQVAEIVIPIDEGPLFRVGGIRFEGIHAFSEDRLRAQVSFQPGDPYTPTLRDRSIIDLQNFYADNGYLEANINYSLDLNEQKNTVSPVFQIEEGQQSLVHQVTISGNDEVTKSLINSQLLMKPGQVLKGSELANSRANLYGTGAFRLVEIDHQPAQGASHLKPGQRAVDVQVKVLEVQPFQWTYGGYYDTDRGPGVISDFSSHNITGNAQTLGLRLRYDRDRQESRLYFSQPLLRRFPVKTTASMYYVRNQHFAAANNQLSLIDDETGLSLEQESNFRKDYLLTWSYSLERVRIFNRGVADTTSTTLPAGDIGSLPGEQNLPLPPLGASISQRVAPLEFTVSRETRNSVLDATRGLFLSNSFSTSFRFLGSQQQFVRYYGQYYQYIPLGRKQKIPFKQDKEPRLVYAGALRLGLAGGLGGQSLIQSERFFAGGGTTIRGFGQDEVGPTQGGVPVGGNALFTLNNELRFPIKWIFDGVGFVDIGNVYPRVSDFNPFSVREGGGFGIRVYTPYVMLRADYGIKLDRRTGESFGQFFFSIGQAF